MQTRRAGAWGRAGGGPRAGTMHDPGTRASAAELRDQSPESRNPRDSRQAMRACLLIESGILAGRELAAVDPAHTRSKSAGRAARCSIATCWHVRSAKRRWRR